MNPRFQTLIQYPDYGRGFLERMAAIIAEGVQAGAMGDTDGMESALLRMAGAFDALDMMASAHARARGATPPEAA